VSGLEDKPFTTLFVDGNHENFDRLDALPVREWHGGKVHEVHPHILHLMRGQVFEIEGYTFFTMGGAASHDIRDGILDPVSPTFEEDYWLKRRSRQMFRVKGVSWWEQEMPSKDEYAEAIRNLERIEYKVDYIITHCAPTSIQQKLSQDFTPDPFTDFLDKIKGQRIITTGCSGITTTTKRSIKSISSCGNKSYKSFDEKNSTKISAETTPRIYLCAVAASGAQRRKGEANEYQEAH